jgi:hypothetical protein
MSEDLPDPNDVAALADETVHPDDITDPATRAESLLAFLVTPTDQEADLAVSPADKFSTVARITELLESRGDQLT